MGAYRKGRPTWTNAGVAAHLISEAFERREQALLIALDLQDAYNLVSLPKLADQLLRLGTCAWLVRWVLSALKSRRCSLKCGQWLSEWANISTALPQGSPLSPVCYNAYTQALATAQTPDNVRLLTFADDISIVVWHRDTAELAACGQQTIDSVRSVCDQLDMVINPRKATVTGFSKRREEPRHPPLFNGDVAIPNVESVKLLGITLDSKLNFNAHVDQTRSRCLRVTSTLKAAFSWGVDLRRLTQLYRSLVLSRITYGLEVINPTINSLTKLDGIQNAALRLISGCPRDTPLTALRFMFNLPSVTELHELMRAKAISRVASDPGHPLHDVVSVTVDVPPKARLERQGWLRAGVRELRKMVGRNTVRRGPAWTSTPADTQERWTFDTWVYLGLILQVPTKYLKSR
ncbi:putative RNA-directed DNA polymerase from transposon BS [Amphibalanus amphitrite]|uniref:Putative RNA-directed DNA polymerase from transposon BS n=1 Tax=Amphibalanus amphitrite TaxID=1232801 RepID=A0A6A4VQM1_AMPAM|nr:putative RNA-directed DNA polymerase from transposon BS [Amphibalanus amphitrite]